MANPAALSDRRAIVIASLVMGPSIMAIGDSLHPEERMAAAEQITIIAEYASRWYAAHLLLYIGMTLFLPGLLTLATLTEARHRSAGYWARILAIIGVAALAAIFVAEMLIGLYLERGGDPHSAVTLLESMLSGRILGALSPAILAFFIGTSMMAIPLIRGGGLIAWAAGLILLGVLLIFVEIVSAKVIFSQIGNVLVACGSSLAAWLILQGRAEAAAPAS